MLLYPPQPPSLPHLAYPPQHAPRALDTVDRLPHPAHRVQDRHPDDSPLDHSAQYNYVPRGHPAHTSPHPDTMYQHNVLHPSSFHSRSDHNPQHQQQQQQQQQQSTEYDIHSRQQPPAIHTENLIYPSDHATFTPSPVSSPADHAVAPNHSLSRPFSFPQPMSAPHTQNAFPQRYVEDQPGLSRMQFTNPTLDRRMSEPVLGAGRPSFPQPPPSHHDTFAYSAAGSATMVQPSPVSPRPSSSYSSYGTYPEHQRDSSGASIGSAGLSDSYTNPVAAWGAGVKQAELEEAQIASSPLSPLYAASAASGSDVSATGLPSPPTQTLHSPSRNTAVPSGAGLRSQHDASGQASGGSTPRPGGHNSKTYSFVSLPGNAVKKRPRRRYDEIERLYQCSWPNCTKAYGTLNHLNAHVTMQRHGPKRNPNEFKELRKKWRQEKKEAEDAERERERESQAMVMREMQYGHHPHPHTPMAGYEHSRFARRRLSMVEPYPDPHGHGGSHSLPNNSYMHSAMQGQGAGSIQAYGNAPQSAPPYGSLQGPAMGIETRYGLPSPAEEVGHLRYSSGHHPSQVLPSLSISHPGADEDMYYRQAQMPPQGELVGPGWGHPHASQHPQAPPHGHPMRPQQQQQQFYNVQGNITLPPPHTLNSLSVSAPNPSPLATGGFPPLGPSTGPGPSLSGGDMGLGMAGAGQESGSPTPELAAHVSLGSNRLPPDSTLLTPLPGYEPEPEQLDDLGRPARERSRERDAREERDRAWGDRAARDREQRYYAGGQGNGRDHPPQYE